jgi:anti-sigma factor RsiW
MRCGKAKRWISASLDGELDARRQRALTAHLSSCERCRAFAAGLDALGEALDASPVEDPRWGLSDRVLARVADVERSPRPTVSTTPSWGRFLRPAPIGVGAAAFCAGAAIVVLANGQTKSTQTQRDVVAAMAGDYFGVESQPVLGDELASLLPQSED